MDGRRWLQPIVRLWSNLFRRSRSTSTGFTDEPKPRVPPDEELSSFVMRKNEVTRTRHIHHSRLIPRRNPATGRLETSVCRSGSLSEEAFWKLCSEHFDRYAPALAIGRGVGRAATVYAEQLSLDADGVPYAEHANIIGWHDETGRPTHELKSYWTDQVQRMAKEFRYRPRPNGM